MYIKVKSVDEIIEKKLEGRFIAGGTDFVPLMKLGLKSPSLLIDVTGIPELRSVEYTGGEAVIGAAVTLSEIAEQQNIVEKLPALAQSAERTASPQIRNVGTIGGNVMQDRRCIFFNQSASWRSSLRKCFKAGGELCLQIQNSPVCRAIYYSDTATALVLYEAEADVLQNGEVKRLPVKELISQHSKANGLRSESSGCLVLRFHVKFPPESERSGFYKYNVRSSIDFPLVNLGVRFSGGARAAMAVAGAIGPEPVVLEKSSKLLDDAEINNEEWTAEAVAEMKAKGGLIRESVVPPKMKLASYSLVSKLLEQLRP